MPLSAGTRLGPYQVLAPIGAGGMGEVYRARDSRLGREVALKILPAAFASDPDRVRRFEQEGRAAAALNHPNIVVIYDAGSEGGVFYVATELLEGETLRERLAGSRAARSQSHRLCHPDRARFGCGARERHHSSRSEARESVPHEGWPGQDPRLRTGETFRD